MRLRGEEKEGLGEGGLDGAGMNLQLPGSIDCQPSSGLTRAGSCCGAPVLAKRALLLNFDDCA